jgi:hypothetical protein
VGSSHCDNCTNTTVASIASGYLDASVGSICALDIAVEIGKAFEKGGWRDAPNTAVELCTSGQPVPTARFGVFTSGWQLGDVACFDNGTRAGMYVRGGAIGAGYVDLCVGGTIERVDHTNTYYPWFLQQFCGVRRMCGTG